MTGRLDKIGWTRYAAHQISEWLLDCDSIEESCNFRSEIQHLSAPRGVCLRRGAAVSGERSSETHQISVESSFLLRAGLKNQRVEKMQKGRMTAKRCRGQARCKVCSRRLACLFGWRASVNAAG